MTLPTAMAGFQTTDVTLSTRIGQGARGPVWSAGVTRTVFVEDSRKIVRDQAGEQVVSETTLFDTPASVDLYVAGSKVTVNGRATTVITAKRHVIGDPDVDHTEVVLA